MAKYEYKSLKDIDKKVEHIMEKLGIQPYNSVEQAILGHQNFFVTDTVYNGERVMFKARIADHRVLRQWGKNFRHERRFLRNLQKNDLLSTISHRMPKYIKSQANSCEWLMCEYIDNKPIGSSNISYDSPNNEEILEIIDLLIDIQKFPIEQFCIQHRWTKDFMWMDFDKYHDLFHRFKKRGKRRLKKVFTQDELDEADEIILSSRALLNGSCTLFTHGDFHPANIILPEQGIAIDWETLRLDNAAWDIATLWLRMVEHPTERHFLLSEFAKVTAQKEFFPELFRLNILCRMLEEISMIWLPLSEREDLPDWQIKIYAQNLEMSRSNYLTAIKGGGLKDYE